MSRSGITLVACLASTAAFAQGAYKCKEGNSYVFQESPCREAVARQARPVAEQQKTAAELQVEFEKERAAEARLKAEGRKISVPSDAGASYFVMDSPTSSGSNRTIVTRRAGTSGESWSKRIYDCANYTAKYLGTGATRAAMDASRPDPNMAIVLPGTIADYVGRVACAGFDIEAIAKGREGEAQAAQAKVTDALAKANSRDDPARQAAAEHAVLKRLKDPGSASFRGMFVSWASGVPIVCGYVNAKNSYGGYTGFKRFVAKGNELAFLESDMDDAEMTKTWMKFCGYRN